MGAVDTVILRGTSGGTIAMPREWTDLAEPSPYEILGMAPAVISLETLLALGDLVEALLHDAEKGVDR